MKKKLLIIGPVLAVVLGCCLVMSPETQWLGGYHGGTFEFEFKDIHGNPVEGIQLEVSNAHGERVDDYLIRDFSKDGRRSSDAKGVLTVRTNNPRFGGSCKYWFFVIPVGPCPPGKGPVINCRFMLRGNEVYATSYKSLSDELVSRGKHEADNTNWSLRKEIVIRP